MPDDWEEEDDWEKDDAADKLKLPDAKGDEVWSDEEGHDSHKQEAPKPVAAAAKPQPPKEKTELEKKIEAREMREKEEAERKAEMLKQMGHRELDLGGVDAATAEKLRKRHAEETADMENALDLMGSMPTAPPAKPAGKATPKPAEGTSQAAPTAKPLVKPPPKPAEGTFEAFEPVSEADFTKLATMISMKLSAYEGTKGHMACLKAIIRTAADKMTTDDAKDLSAMVTVVYNDKIKADKDKDKKGKPKGKAGWGAKTAKAGGGRDDNDLDDIGSGGGVGWGGGGGGRDEDHDFM